MIDLLVALRNLPSSHEAISRLQAEGIEVRRPLGPEMLALEAWIGKEFSSRWASEARKALANTPVSCLMATHDKNPIGFVCFDATARGMLGPMGVEEKFRGHHIGQALLIQALHDMQTMGYAYAVIGGVGPIEFYRGVIPVMEIPDSESGLYDKLIDNPS